MRKHFGAFVLRGSPLRLPPFPQLIRRAVFPFSSVVVCCASLAALRQKDMRKTKGLNMKFWITAIAALALVLGATLIGPVAGLVLLVAAQAAIVLMWFWVHPAPRRDLGRAVMLLVMLAALALPALAFAQAEAVTPAAPANNWITALIPLVVPIIVAGIKLALPRLPKAWLPIAAVALGAGLDLVSHWTTGSTSSPLLGAIMGAAGVGIREILDQVKKLSNPPTA